MKYLQLELELLIGTVVISLYNGCHVNNCSIT